MSKVYLILVVSVLVLAQWSQAYFGQLRQHSNKAGRISYHTQSILFGSTEQQQVGAVEKLTQKEYLIAVRNRLFAVEEQIWLHEYAIARPQQDKIQPFSDTKYDALLRARLELMDEYPVVKLYSDLRDAQLRNMTYAAMYVSLLSPFIIAQYTKLLIYYIYIYIYNI